MYWRYQRADLLQKLHLIGNHFNQSEFALAHLFQMPITPHFTNHLLPVSFCLLLSFTVFYCLLLSFTVFYCLLLSFTVYYCLTLSHSVSLCLTLSHSVSLCRPLSVGLFLCLFAPLALSIALALPHLYIHNPMGSNVQPHDGRFRSPPSYENSLLKAIATCIVSSLSAATRSVLVPLAHCTCHRQC